MVKETWESKTKVGLDPRDLGTRSERAHEGIVRETGVLRKKGAAGMGEDRREKGEQ